MNTERTKGKLIVFEGSIYEENPKEERLVAEMFRDPDPTTGKYLRPATESDANAHHLVACWNAIEELGGDPQVVIELCKRANQYKANAQDLREDRDSLMKQLAKVQ